MNLQQFFSENKKVALAFSGGVDSAYLLYFGQSIGADIKAYFVKSQFQPEFEYQDALRLSKELGAKIEIIEKDQLVDPIIASNPQNRCYLCKKAIMKAITARAKEDGYTVILDGTNASDDFDDRPGMRAAEEIGVLSPLRLCGLTKADIRKLSKEAGLFTWNKPSYACLATRIPFGQTITGDLLQKVEKAEDEMRALGFSDFRVRVLSDGNAAGAKIQVREEEFSKALANREAIVEKLKPLFNTVLLDMEGR